MASPQFPRRVLDLAGSRLGEPVGAFDARPGFRRAVTWLALLGTADLLLALSAVFYLVQGPRWLGAGGLLLAAVYLAGAGWIVRGGALRGRGRAVYVFTGGLVHLAPRRTHLCRWSDLRGVTIAAVRPEPGGRTRWRFTVTAADGTGFVLDDALPDVGDLGERIVAEVSRCELPRARAAVEAGRTVRFGPFTVDRDGVGKDGETVPWDAVDDAELGNGMVSLRRLDGRPDLSAVAGLVPNALVFVELCRWARPRRGKHGRERPAIQ